MRRIPFAAAAAFAVTFVATTAPLHAQASASAKSAADSAQAAQAAAPKPGRRGFLSRATSAIAQKTGLSDVTAADAANGAVKVASIAASMNPTVQLAKQLKQASDQQRKQSAVQQAGSVATTAARAMVQTRATGSVAPSSEEMDDEMQALSARQMALVSRASAGDAEAAKGLERFQREIADIGLRVATLPMDRQATAMTEAMRQALTCAESNRGCRHAR